MTWREKAIEELEVHIRYRPTNAPDDVTVMMEYEVRDACFYADEVSFPEGKDMEDTSPILNGQIKWDGCSHNYFGEEEMKGYIHGCSRKDMVRLGAIFDALFDLAATLMPENREDLS